MNASDTVDDIHHAATVQAIIEGKTGVKPLLMPIVDPGRSASAADAFGSVQANLDRVLAENPGRLDKVYINISWATSAKEVSASPRAFEQMSRRFEEVIRRGGQVFIGAGNGYANALSQIPGVVTVGAADRSTFAANPEIDARYEDRVDVNPVATGGFDLTGDGKADLAVARFKDVAPLLPSAPTARRENIAALVEDYRSKVNALPIESEDDPAQTVANKSSIATFTKIFTDQVEKLFAGQAVLLTAPQLATVLDVSRDAAAALLSKGPVWMPATAAARSAIGLPPGDVSLYRRDATGLLAKMSDLEPASRAPLRGTSYASPKALADAVLGLRSFADQDRAKLPGT